MSGLALLVLLLVAVTTGLVLAGFALVLLYETEPNRLGELLLVTGTGLAVWLGCLAALASDPGFRRLGK